MVRRRRVEKIVYETEVRRPVLKKSKSPSPARGKIRAMSFKSIYPDPTDFTVRKFRSPRIHCPDGANHAGSGKYPGDSPNIFFNGKGNGLPSDYNINQGVRHERKIRLARL